VCNLNAGIEMVRKTQIPETISAASRMIFMSSSPIYRFASAKCMFNKKYPRYLIASLMSIL